MSTKRPTRSTEGWRAYHREYYQKNKERIRARARVSQRAHYKANYEKYKDHIKAAQAAYYAKNREHLLAKQIAYGKRNVEKKLAYDKERQLSRYGLTVQQFDEWSQRIGGRCEICHRLPGGRHMRLGIDHCHKTRMVRGLLCTRCNTALGGFGDSIETLQAAIRYLEAVQAKESVA